MLVQTLGHAFLANQRFGQPLRVVEVIETVTPLDAQAAEIGRTVTPFDAQDLVVLDVVSQQAADTAVRADRVDLAIGFHQVGAAGVAERPVGQAATHSPQATQVDSPIGSPISKTISA